uniref:Uncharacterized protein n=1 Tax=Astatotilapia calliptera TaxID=8154 RepID=A0AAX7SUV3_ASTCA
MSFYLKMVLKQQSECDQTYPSRLLIWEDAALAACCEVAVNLEGVPGAALVWINPVLTWTDKGREKTHKNTPTHTHTRMGERERHARHPRWFIKHSFLKSKSCCLITSSPRDG